MTIQTPTGPTSTEPDDALVTHTCDLIERHRITLPVGSTEDNVAAARLVAEDWAEAQGMELRPGSFSVIASTNGLPIASQGGFLGVTFEVTVGKGDIDADQRLPGVLDRWTWSARMLHWRRILTNADGREGRRIVAREEAKGGRVLPGPWGGKAALEGPARSGLLRGNPDGCTCHIGGPFTDICPVHYQADR